LEQQEKPEIDPSTLYNYRIVNIISVAVLVISSLLTVVISHATLYYLARSPFYYLLLGLVMLLIDGFIIVMALRLRNKIAMRNALKKRGKGFFVIPVYRDFLSDLSSTRSALNLSSANRSQSPFVRPESPKEVTASNGVNAQLKLQKQDYEVISNKRVMGSQALLILFYLQFVVEVALAYLYRHLEENKNKITIAIILVHPLISFGFKKVAERLNEKLKLSMDIYISFVNWLVLGIFSKITYLFIEGFALIIGTIVVKLIYKVVIYVFIKKEAEAWSNKNLMNLGNMVLREQTMKKKKNS